MNRLIFDLPESQYHADAIPDVGPPTLSASMARMLVLKSPLHAWTYHPRFGGARGESTEPQENGNLIHALLLGTGREIVPVDAADFRTKAAKEARQAARDAGKIAVIADKLTFAKGTAEILRRRMSDAGVTLDGKSEVTAVWQSDGALCRGRFDHLCADGVTIVDLKTTESAHPTAIQRSIENFGTDIQIAAYIEAMGTIFPALAGGIKFRLAYLECEPPHAVTIVECAGSMFELGRRRWARAKTIWKRCLAENRWPGYADGVVSIEASTWAMAREEDAQLDANPGADF